MTTEGKTPQIRFKGFAGGWEEKKIGDVLTEKKRPIILDDNIPYRLVTVKRRNEGIVLRNVLKGKNILVKTYFELNVGDYLISKRQVIHGATGIVPKSLDKAIVSNEYFVCIGNNDITSEFLMLLSKKPYMYKLFFISSYGVDIEKLVFDVNDWKKRLIVIPSLREQKKITGHFQHLDKLIEQKEKKYQKLQQFKKAMLYKMFPKNGATSPEVRFKGFSEEWEEKKLGDIGDFKSGIGFPENEQGGDFGIPFFKVSDMNLADNTFYMKSANHYVTNEQISKLKFKVIREASIIFAKVGAAIFLERKRIALTFLIDNNMMAFVPKANLLFIKYVFDTIKLSKYTQVGALPSYNASDLKIIEVKIPFSTDEQTKIGNYFQRLDKLIDLHLQELKKLKIIKKASLEKMFV